jgi:hypothetical protein
MPVAVSKAVAMELQGFRNRDADQKSRDEERVAESVRPEAEKGFP